MNEKTFMCLVQVLGKCKRWGYTDVWFNHENSHWRQWGAMDGMIVAAPNRKEGGRPALWGLGYDPLEREVIGSMGCGNGLKSADQGQWHNVDKNIPRSHYTLVDGDWLLEEELNVEETTNGI